MGSITAEELKALPRKVGRMQDDLELYRLLAACKLQMMEHALQVVDGQPCSECRWSLVREDAPCAEGEALEDAAREAEGCRARQGGHYGPLGARVARWRREAHRRTCVTCQAVQLRLVIEDGPGWRRLCPAFQRLLRAKRIDKRRIWDLILKEQQEQQEQAGG